MIKTTGSTPPPTFDEYVEGFKQRREAATESQDDEDLYRIVNELDSCEALQRALAKPKSVFEARVASSGAQACSAMGDPSAVTPAHLN